MTMININKKEEQAWYTALYIRLSQDDKDKSVSNSIINQKKLLNDYVSQIKDEEFKVIDNYIDDGYTGTDFNRPAFKRMMKAVKSGRVNCIVVKDLSRFGREHIDVDNYLERIFPLMGVRFISIMQHLDSFKNPEKMNSIEIPFLNLINEEYARDISRKTKASLETKRKEGKYVYARAPYDYKKDPEDKYHLIIDELKAENIIVAYNLYLSGESIASIVKNMKEKSKSQSFDDYWDKKKIRNMLSNRIYTGDMVQGITSKYNHKIKKRYTLPEEDWIIVPNTHEAIINKDKFNIAQIQLMKGSCPKSEDTEPSILAGYLKCADCSKRMVRTSATINGRTYRRFVCSTYKKLGKEACTSHIIGEDVLLGIILTTIPQYRLR